jgi:hypothetical protein
MPVAAPADGASQATGALCSEAARNPYPRGEHTRAATAGDRRAYQLWPLGRRPHRVSRGARQSEPHDTCRAAQPLHDPVQQPKQHSTDVITGIERRLRSLPPPLRRSITFDRGTEFTRYPRLASALNIVSLFLPALSALAKGQRREHQRPHPALPAVRHRHLGDIGPPAARDGRSAEQYASKVPRLSNTAGGSEPAA